MVFGRYKGAPSYQIVIVSFIKLFIFELALANKILLFGSREGYDIDVGRFVSLLSFLFD